MATVWDGQRKIDFNNQDLCLAYLSQSTSSNSSASLSAYVEEFKQFPMVDDVLIAYFDESTKATENGLRIAPAVLLGAISELLILKLLKAIGNYLEDLNAITNYDEKRTITAKEDYTVRILRIGHNTMNNPVALSQAEEQIFADFNTIVDHMFDSIRLRRNEIMHPTPETTLDNFPTAAAMRAHIEAFNPYAKIILQLIEIFNRPLVNASVPQPINPTP
jgi:hypothetical protein